MNELDSHQLGREILKLFFPPPDSPLLLARVARMTGKQLGAVACLLVDDRDDPELSLHGYWCAEDYLPRKDAIASQLFARVQAEPSSPPLKWSHFIPVPPRGGMVLEGNTTAGWQDLQPEAQEAIANAVAIILARVRCQQQIRVNAAYPVLLEQFHSPHSDQLDLDLALATTATALQVDRGAIILLKYSDPLYNRYDSTVIPPARCTIAHQWTAREEILKIQTGSAFGLQDCSCCIAAWQSSPQPLAIARLSEKSKSDRDFCIPAFFHPEDFPALLLVPLIGTASNSSLVLGFFLFQRDRPYRWQLEEIALVRWAGAQIATAAIYNRTIKQVQSLVNKRTAQLQGSLEVQAKLYEQTRKQVEQLRQLIELKDEFLDSVSHELRTPLTTMKVAIRMLRQPGLPPERQAKYLETLEREWTREYNLIQDLLALQKLETQQTDLQLTKINLKEIVAELQISFHETWAEKELQLVVRYQGENEADPPAHFYSDRDSLKRILQELLANAGKYSDPDSTIYLDIAVPSSHHPLEAREDATIAIVNVGEGIAPENIESIFDKFTRGKEANQQAIAGTGLGLALVKGLVQHLNGKIEVWSRVASDFQRGETRFTIILPQTAHSQ